MRANGDLAGAIAEYRTAMSIGNWSQSSWLREYLAEALAMNGETEAAIEEYEMAISLKPSDAYGAWTEIGFIWLKRGDLDKATRALQNALQNRPIYMKANYGLGLVLFEEGKYAEAVHFMQESLPESPDDEQLGVHYFLGRAKAALGQY